MLYHRNNLEDIEKCGEKEVRNVIATVKGFENIFIAWEKKEKKEKNLKLDRNNLDNCIIVHNHV